MRKRDKPLWGWAIYDWANSAFATTVMAGFFPIFFKQYWSAGADINLTTARLGIANGAAGLLVAVMAPVLGAVSDTYSSRKQFLLCFAYFGVVMTMGLFMVGKGQWHLAAGVYILAVIGWSGANIFYDSLLPAVAPPLRMDQASAFGFSLGYLGGGALFLINVAMTLYPEVFGLADKAAAVRWSFLTAGLWWGGFCAITIFWVPGQSMTSAEKPLPEIIRNAFSRVWTNLRQIRKYRPAALFLAAYWFYIDGVHTIIRMAVDYGLSLGFRDTDLILALLLVQFVGFPAALLFGRSAKKFGARPLLFFGIGVYMAVTLYAGFMTRRYEFYLLAVSIGLVQGGIQALSRSCYARLIPLEHAARFFGFYNMIGKFAAIIGPILMGLTGLVIRRILMPPSPSPETIIAVGRTASRAGIFSILLLFIVGALLLYVAKPDESK